MDLTTLLVACHKFSNIVLYCYYCEINSFSASVIVNRKTKNESAEQ